MTTIRRVPPSSTVALLVAFASVLANGASGQDGPLFLEWAKTPPMGWNSWDYYGTSITEKQVKEQAKAMARYLLPAGYDILTVDIQWYEPDAKGHHYRPGAPLEMDEFGRLLPATKRFPSASRGRGFGPLANYVHDRGLRFGIHIMRGIPRQAVERNTPVFGTTLRARDIAVTTSCLLYTSPSPRDS